MDMQGLGILCHQGSYSNLAIFIIIYIHLSLYGVASIANLYMVTQPPSWRLREGLHLIHAVTNLSKDVTIQTCYNMVFLIIGGFHHPACFFRLNNIPATWRGRSDVDAKTKIVRWRTYRIEQGANKPSVCSTDMHLPLKGSRQGVK
jgi:hypothetical protein